MIPNIFQTNGEEKINPSTFSSVHSIFWKNLDYSIVKFRPKEMTLEKDDPWGYYYTIYDYQRDYNNTSPFFKEKEDAENHRMESIKYNKK